MKKYTIKVVPYKRKTEGKTNYRRRLKMLVSHIPRLVIRRTNKHIIVQVVKYSPDGDIIVVTATSAELKKQGWTHATGNLPAAYLTALIAGKRALKKNITKAIVDFGLQRPLKGSRLYAAVKGAIDSGMDIPCDPEVLPPEDRIKGKHIADYESKQFKVSPKTMEKDFEAVKAKLK